VKEVIVQTDGVAIIKPKIEREHATAPQKPFRGGP